MKFAITIVSPPGYVHAECFREVAETLDYGLKALGHDSIVTKQASLPDRRHIVLGWNLLAKQPMEFAPDAIIYNLEQIRDNPVWLKQGLPELFRRHVVWDYAADNVAALAEAGIKVAHVLPIGYAPVLTRIQPVNNRDIDVVFAGSINERRRDLLVTMRTAGLKVTHLFGAYGIIRDATVARAKLVLNVHFFPAKLLEVVRISYYLANGWPVLSEPSSDPDEDAAYADGVVFCDYDRMVDRAVQLCQTPAELAAVGSRGLELMRGRSIEPDLAEALSSLS